MWRELTIAFFLLTVLGERLDAVNFQKGDILLSFIAGSPKLQRYRPDGSLVQSFEGSGAPWLGATMVSNQQVVTTRRSPVPGINIFDANGNEFTFDIDAEVLPGDVSAFSDGVLAISDQNGRVVLYSPMGDFIGEIAHPDIVDKLVFGSAIAPDDSLWIPVDEDLFRFSRSGSLLDIVALPFAPRGITIDHVDGTIWVSGGNGNLHNFTVDGTELSSFMTAATPPFLHGIAVGPDRSLFVTSLFSRSVYQYDRNGQLLNEFNVASTGRPTFMSIVLVPEPATSFVVAIVAFICILAFTRGPTRRTVTVYS